jgi:predicted Zn-dependent protease
MRHATPVAVLVLTLSLVARAAPPPAAGKDDARARMLTALVSELERSQKELKLDDNERPFFIGLQVKDFDSRELLAKHGALYTNEARRMRNLLADVRVGSYELDSTPDPDAFGFDFDFDGGGYTASKDLPIDDDARALKRAVWLVVDEQYKRALTSYLKKRGKQINRPDDKDRPPSFSREVAVTSTDPVKPFAFDNKAWADEARRASGRFLASEGIFDGEVRVTADKVVRIFASTEGTRIVTEQVIFGLHMNAYARAEDGMLLENGRTFYGATEAELPRGEALDKAVATIVEELQALRKAPVIDPFTGPAVLAPEATGVLFHEAVGHRLEGERQDDENEGRTFKGQVGRAVLPTFISVFDDPTAKAWKLDGKDVSLNGFYGFDEQGVAAQAVTLIDAGVLKTYLMSRHSVKGFSKSNGHGRSASNRMPVARMANLVVKPLKTVPEADLRKMLLEEARRQKKQYGIFIKDITGGNTNTANAGYQAFKGTGRMVVRIDAETGKEELVRGVEIVGTPLSSINRIVAMGDRFGVFNGYCGAESGYVPVSTVAPGMLLTEIELQRTRKDIGRPPLMPAPSLLP